MRFYNSQHQFYAGIDLHARKMYICIIDNNGNKIFHKNMDANPLNLIQTIIPYKENIIVGVECVFTWYWMADCCEDNMDLTKVYEIDSMICPKCGSEMKVIAV